MKNFEFQSDKQQAFEVKKGVRIVKENELSRKMYIILEGKARVSKTYLGQRITLAVLGDGEIFGEMSFIDAQPRSASVDALTDMKLIVLDAEAGLTDFKNLPNWIWTIMRIVFFRFRELDRQILTLQSAVNFRKKGMKTDVVASSIYLELKRFMKTLQLLRDGGKSLNSEADLRDELDDILGNRALGMRDFWKQLQEADFMRVSADGVPQFQDKSLVAFMKYLDAEIGKERYLILTHGAIAILRRIVVCMPHDDSDSEDFILDMKTAKLNQIPGWEAAFEELCKLNFLAKSGPDELTMNKETIHDLFTFQSFLKVFDHSAIHID